MNPMENDPSSDPRIIRLLALKRLENPPPGFPDYFRGRVMRAIAAERERAERAWWNRFFDEVTWPRGMLAANTLTLAGVAFLAAATFQVAHSVANEDLEGQAYAALPLPHNSMEPNLHSDDQNQSLIAAHENSSTYRPLPSSGGAAPIIPTFTLTPSSPETRSSETPKWLFNPPSMANPQFILASDREKK